MALTDEVSVKVKDGEVNVEARNPDERRSKAMWGTTRANIQNMITGVTTGFTKDLELVGVGYRAAMKGKDLELSLGYSHPVVYKAPAGITFTSAKPTEIKISGADKQAVGQVRPLKSVAGVRQSPTRAKVSARSASTSAAKKARRSKPWPRFNTDSSIAAPSASVRNSARLPLARRAFPLPVRPSTSRCSSSTTPKASRLLPPRRLRRLQGRHQVRRRSCCRQAHCPARVEGWRHRRGFRPRRLHLSWPRESARRCRPRGRPEILGSR